MNAILVVILIVAVVATVVSLVRGIIAFLQTTKVDLENQVDEDRVMAMQAKQNRMMLNRIKFQALAVVIVAVLLMLNQ